MPRMCTVLARSRKEKEESNCLCDFCKKRSMHLAKACNHCIEQALVPSRDCLCALEKEYKHVGCPLPKHAYTRRLYLCQSRALVPSRIMPSRECASKKKHASTLCLPIMHTHGDMFTNSHTLQERKGKFVGPPNHTY